MKKNNLFRKALSITLAVSMMATQIVGVLPVAAADDSATQGVFVEYFDEYDRRTDYTVTPYSPTPGNETNDYDNYDLTHTGIPDETPITWSYFDSDMDDYWGNGTTKVEADYEGNDLSSDNFFAVRYSAMLTTPDYAGTYYFRVGANDSKALRIYDADSRELMAEYVRWNGTGSAASTYTSGGGSFGTVDGIKSGFTAVDLADDVISIELDAETAYYVEFDFCEGLATAYAKLFWAYDDDAAIAALQTTNSAGTGHEDYLIPADFFTLAPEHDGDIVQGYVYDEDGNAVGGVELVTDDGASTVSEANGYYCMVAESDDVTVSATYDVYVGSSVAEDGVVPSIYLEEGNVTKYTVTFSVYGAEPTTVEVVEGRTVDELAAPDMGSKVFTGWLDSEGNPFDFSTEIYANTEITAGYRDANEINVDITVVDEAGEYVQDASIKLGDSYTATTGIYGLVQFGGVDEGTSTLIVSKSGYKTVSMSVEVGEDTEDMAIEVVMVEFAGEEVRQWATVDIDIEGTVPEGSNAFMDTAGKVNAVFTSPSGTVASVNAFYRDDGVWTVRFSPDELGEWTYVLSYNEDNDYVYEDGYYDPAKDLPVDESEQYDAAYGAIFDGQAGSIICVENTNELMHGGVIRDPDNLQYFSYQDGTPYYMASYEVDWMGMMDQGLPTGEIPGAEAMIEMLQMMGYTHVQMNAFGWDTSWSNGYDGKNDDTEDWDFGPCDDFPWKTVDDYAFTDSTYTESNADKIDFTQMNESYWAKMDEVVAAMTEAGITANIFWKVYNKYVVYDNGIESTNDYDDEPWLTYADTMFARYFCDRYSAYNVILDMGKESYNIGWTAATSITNQPDHEGGGFYIDTMIREMRAFNDYYDRIITIHDWDTYYTYLNYTATAGYYDTTNGVYDYNGSITDMVQMVSDQIHLDSGDGSSYDYYLGKLKSFPELPFLNNESCYQQSNNSATGGSGHYNTYGASNDELTPEAALREYAEATLAGVYWAHYYTNHAWDIVKYEEVPDQWQYFNNLITFISEDVGTDVWAHMTADDDLISGSTSGATSYTVADGLKVQHAMATEGTNYLVYTGYGTDTANKAAPSGMDTVTITVSDVDASKPLSGIWYNLMTGETQEIDTVISTDGTYTFTVPATGWSDVEEINGTEQQGSGEGYMLYLAAPETPAEGDVASVKTTTSLSVKYGTDLSTVEAALPTTVTVTAENGVDTVVSVIWDTTSYEASAEDLAEHTYTFVGTLTDLPDGVANGDAVTATATVTVREFVQEWTVTFVSDDSTVSTQVVEEGQAATQPADPTLDGCVFTGWTVDGESYTFGAVMGDTTVVASWRELSTADVSITVLNLDGTPAYGATVELGGETQTITEIPSGVEDATVIFYDVLEGDHTATITMADKATVTRAVTVDEVGEADEVITYMVEGSEGSGYAAGLVLNYYMGLNTLDVPEDTVADHTEIVTDSIYWRYEIGEDPYEGAEDAYSLNYSGAIYIETAGTYSFYMEVACAARLSIDGTKIFEQTSDKWTAASDLTGSIYLDAGYHTFDLDMYQAAGYAAAGRLYWGNTSTLVPGTVFFQSTPMDVVTYVEPLDSKTLDVGTVYSDASIHNGDYTVMLASGETATASVTWDSVSFDAVCNTAGTYTVYGALTMPDGVENPGNLEAAITVTFVSTASATDPSASVALEVAVADTANDSTTFNLLLEEVANVKAIYFKLSDATAVVTAGEGFNVYQLEDTYMLAYGEQSFDELTGSDIIAATITIAGEDGAVLTISDVVVATPEMEADATITTATADSTEAFDVEGAIATKVAEIEAAQATYATAEAEYMSEDWAELTAIFTDAIAEVQTMTDIADVEAVLVSDLTAAADAVSTKLDRFDLNNDGYITLADVACITVYFGHAVDATTEKYDVDNNDNIGNEDYLMVYQNMDS